MNKEFIKPFLQGFFSIFKIIPITSKEPRDYNVFLYFYKAERYINSSFKKVRNRHERN